VLEPVLHDGRPAVVDDLHLLVDSLDWQTEARLAAAMTVVLDEAARRGRTLLFATDESTPPAPLSRRCHAWKMDAFGPADYEHICRNDLGPLD
jgi:hypothetical protein